MKKNNFLWQIVSVLVCLAAIIFLILPDVEGSVRKEVYDFPDELISVDENAAWIIQLSEVLQDYQLELQYPESVWFGRAFILRISLVVREGVSDTTVSADAISPFIMEARLAMDDVKVKPGSTLLLPVQLPQITYLQMEVSPQTGGDKQGRIWISIYPTSEDGDAVPVFVFPVEVQVHSFFGIKTGIWQAVWSCLGFGGILVIFFTARKKRK